MKKLLSFIAIGLVSCILHLASVTAQTPTKKVLLEEFTTASCGNCPMMSAHINTWHEAHADSTILMAIHEGSGTDAMTTSTMATIFNAMHPAWGWFAPAIMMDRTLFPWLDSVPYYVCVGSWGSGTGPGIDTVAERLMRGPAKVGVNISGTYNSVTRTINAIVTANFVSAVPSYDWRINLFLVEDSVVGYPGLGAFAGWDQHCYDANWANTNYPGMFDGTSIIGYPHRHVMRNSFLGNWGAQGIIPAVPVVGTNYTASGTVVVDTGYHDNRLSLVAFVSAYGANQDQKFVLNANDVVLSSSFSTSINEIANTSPTSSIESIYPQPSSGPTKLIYTLAKDGKCELTIKNILGQQMEVLLASSAKAGKHETTFDVSNYAKGIYFISMKTNENSVVRKFIVE